MVRIIALVWSCVSDHEHFPASTNCFQVCPRSIPDLRKPSRKQTNLDLTLSLIKELARGYAKVPAWMTRAVLAVVHASVASHIETEARELEKMSGGSIRE